ncbi:DUF1275 family protein [Nocardia sp. R6R-6]|uniref:DUF1275 family protein n=1 Tax=Nocardia sp. R6R-6 TaxID=3459303 RepID=UPI00403E1F83
MVVNGEQLEKINAEASGSRDIGMSDHGTDRVTRPARGDDPSKFPVVYLVMLLTVGTGALDASVLVAVGEAFPSVMTGNLVLLGLAVGTQSGAALALVGAAILGYAVGGAVGSALLHRLTDDRDPGVWPRAVTRVLGVQLSLLLALAAGWTAAGGDFGTRTNWAVLACAAFTMGMQGAAVRGIRVTVSTTYMTGALTTLIEAIVRWRRFTTTENGAAAGLISLVAGAALGGLLAHTSPASAIWVPVTSLGTVVVAACAYRARQTRVPQEAPR